MISCSSQILRRDGSLSAHGDGGPFDALQLTLENTLFQVQSPTAKSGSKHNRAAMRAGRKADGYNLSFSSPWVIDILGSSTSISSLSTVSMSRLA
jgi:hypothetical protein